MKNALILAALAVLAGCMTVNLPPGTPEESVLATLGKPSHQYQDGNYKILEYSSGPFGQQTYLATIGPDGKLSHYEQVLTMEKFAAVKVGVTTKEDVLHMFGAPGETSYLPLRQMDVWSYAYKENNVWDSMMHVHFDSQGVVQQMMNGPDPNRDPEMRFGHGHGSHR